MVDGFESFELLRPTEGTDRYLVVTKWRDEAAFQAWVSSDAFQRGHARARADADAGAGAGHGGHQPAAVGSELWGFEIAASATRAQG